MANRGSEGIRVVIVGGGVVGAAIAFALSGDPRWQVTLLERQSQGGQGTSAAALGVLMGIISQKTKGRAWRLRDVSVRLFPQWLAQVKAITGRSLGANGQGIVLLCQDGGEWPKWEKLQALRASQGWCLDLWSPAQLTDRCPQVAGGWAGAVYSPQDYQISPQRWTQGLLAAAIARGVTVRYGGEVTRIAHGMVHCTQGTIAFDRLVLSGGLGVTALLGDLDLPPLEGLVLEPVLGQAIRVRLPQPLGDPAFQPVITGHDVHLVPLVHQGDPRDYWLGATVEFHRAQGDPAAWRSVWDQAIALWPGLAQGEIIDHWQGLRPRPVEQSAPVVRSLPSHPEIFLAAGHYRNGVLLAPATGQAVYDWLQTMES